MPSAAATAQEECSRSDKKEAAALLKQIEEAARQGVFDQADRLRDRLINLDGMMLTEIIKAAEIIEAAKTAAISPEHLRTWQALTEILSPEEFAALYHGLTPRSYARGEDVVRQGDYLSQLIFINSGQIEILAETAQGSYLLKTAGPGEVLGGDTFFEASVWTVTGRSLGAEVLMLSRKTLEQLAESHPALESKMMDFCMRPISVETIFRNSGRSRRHFSRRALTGRTAVQLLDGSGRDTRITFKGELADVSCGGVSFFARVSRRKSANRLCGGKIRIDIPSSNSRPGIVRTGKIVAIRGHHLVSNEYTVHVRFDAALTVQEMQQVAVGCC